MYLGQSSRVKLAAITATMCLVFSWLITPAGAQGKKAAATKKAATTTPPPARPVKKYFEHHPTSANLQQAKGLRGDAGKILRGTLPFDEAGKARLTTYYAQVYFPLYTIESRWGKWPELRRDFLTKDIRQAKVPAATEFVLDLARKRMLIYATHKNTSGKTFHPVVRHNAMLLIGELNRLEKGARGPDGSRAQYSDPYAPAFDTLVAEFKNTDQIDAVKVAALVGMLRHAKLDIARDAERRIPGNTRASAVNDLLAFVKSAPAKFPNGTERSVEGHTWMQRRAIEIIAALGGVGPVPDVDITLENLVGDESVPNSLRCTAAEALAQWSNSNKAKLDVVAAPQKLGLLAAQACLAELAEIQKVLKRDLMTAQLRALVDADPLTADAAAKARGGTANATSGGRSNGGGGMASMGAGMGGMEGMAGGIGGEDKGGDDGMAGMGALMGAGMGGGEQVEVETTGPADPRVNYFRRRLKYQLACVRKGLGGVAVAAKDGENEELKQVADGVMFAYAVTDPPPDNLPELAQAIKRGYDKLAFLMPSGAGGDVLDDVLDAEPDSLPGDDLGGGLPEVGAEGEAPAADPGEAPAEEAGLPPSI